MRRGWVFERKWGRRRHSAGALALVDARYAEAIRLSRGEGLVWVTPVGPRALVCFGCTVGGGPLGVGWQRGACGRCRRHGIYWVAGAGGGLTKVLAFRTGIDLLCESVISFLTCCPLPAALTRGFPIIRKRRHCTIRTRGRPSHAGRCALLRPHKHG